MAPFAARTHSWAIVLRCNPNKPTLRRAFAHQDTGSNISPVLAAAVIDDGRAPGVILLVSVITAVFLKDNSPRLALVMLDRSCIKSKVGK